MENNSVTFAVNGLVDGLGASQLLGFGKSNPRRFSTWLAKATQLTKAGKPLSPLLALLPEPAGKLNGAPVYTVESILAFGELAEGLIGSRGRPARVVDAVKAAEAEIAATPEPRTTSRFVPLDDSEEF